MHICKIFRTLHLRHTLAAHVHCSHEGAEIDVRVPVATFIYFIARIGLPGLRQKARLPVLVVRVLLHDALILVPPAAYVRCRLAEAVGLHLLRRRQRCMLVIAVVATEGFFSAKEAVASDSMCLLTKNASVVCAP